jgi:hypothetical protein
MFLCAYVVQYSTLKYCNCSYNACAGPRYLGISLYTRSSEKKFLWTFGMADAAFRPVRDDSSVEIKIQGDFVPLGTFCESLYQLFKNISFIVFYSK